MSFPEMPVSECHSQLQPTGGAGVGVGNAVVVVVVVNGMQTSDPSFLQNELFNAPDAYKWHSEFNMSNPDASHSSFIVQR